MKKVVKVKEIKSSVKNVKEVHKSGSDEGVGNLTKGEVGFSEVEMDRVTEPVQMSVGSSVRIPDMSPTLEGSAQSVTVPVASEMNVGNLYDVGKTLSGQTSGAEYKPIDTVASQQLRSVNVGKDFAMGSQGSDYPEAQALQNKIRQDSDKPYHGSRMDAERGGGAKRKYPWEL